MRVVNRRPVFRLDLLIKYFSKLEGGASYKGFNLVKRENKKQGFVYYVRYRHNGKTLPTKWNTHTNVKEEAERFAREKRNTLVERYLRSHDGQMFNLLEKFYAGDSEYLAAEQKRNKPLGERGRKEYHAVIRNRFIPFLKERHIGCLVDFQDTLLAGGNRPQTVNNKLKAVKRFLDVHSQVFGRANYALAQRLKVSEAEVKARHITYYSGRHYWKTLMSREGLGEDVEEIFMGHKVSSNVAKRYNHRDKQGREQMVKKAKQVFSILNRCLFGVKPKR